MKLLTINHVHHDAGAARRCRLTSVIPCIRCLRIRDAQPDDEHDEKEQEQEQEAEE